MSAATYNLVIDQGSDFALDLIVKESGTALNLTNYSGRAQLRTSVTASSASASFTVTKTDAAAGKLKMEFRDKTKEILQGEMIIVHKGVEHRPSADEETWILLFEPVNTKHTGDTISKITKDIYPKI